MVNKNLVVEQLEIAEINKDPQIRWCGIFNRFEYFELHQNGSSHYFILHNKENNEIIGVCHFTETERGVYVSPSRGTFAGIEVQQGNIHSLAFFAEKLEVLLKEKGAKKIIISAAPFDHSNSFSSYLFNALHNLGYKVENHELNYSIRVDEKDLIEKMHYNNKKRLKKCIREGYIFDQAQTREEFEEVYYVIEANRKSKGINISMTFEQIMLMYERFSDSVFFFKAAAAGTCVAGSICIKLNSSVLYVFYWGDLPGYEQYSPISLIADGIYRFARENNFKLLDAGISTFKGVPNYGLIKFKENLGFEVSLKLRYEKDV